MKVKLNSIYKNLELYFSDLNTTWKSKEENFYNYNVSINDYKFGFSEVSIKNNQKLDTYLSDIKIIGPTIEINNFEIKAETFSENWIIKEKINRFKNREKIPRLAIKKIKEASDLYKVDNKIFPKDINQLDLENYLEFDQYPFNDYGWKYNIDLPNTITAAPTRLNISPNTDFVIYNFQEDRFRNNPILDSLVNIPNAQWIYSFAIQKIAQNFLSSFNLLITPERKSFTAEIIKGNFKMDNLQFSAIPDNKLEDITYFKIPKIELEINDFFFDGTLTEFPKINRLKTNFKVRNFDLKLPEGLIEEPGNKTHI